MTDEKRDDGREAKPSAVADLRRGLGLLFRAAKTTAKTTLDALPSHKIEDVVVSGAREVGRALENVTHTVEKQIFRKPSVKSDGTGDDDAKSDPPKPR